MGSGYPGEAVVLRTLDIPRAPQAPARARAAVDELRGELPGTLVDDARLLVSELVTNSVLHGEGSSVRVVIDVVDGERLRCEVVDGGSGFVPMARTKAKEEPGGWGLALVERLSAEWGVRQGSTHVWFELRPRD